MIDCILMILVIILSVWIYKVKKREKCKQENRDKLIELALELSDIQCEMLKERFGTQFNFELEIEKYICDYLLPNIKDSKFEQSGKFYAHRLLVMKYPELFKIFDGGKKQEEASTEENIKYKRGMETQEGISSQTVESSAK